MRILSQIGKLFFVQNKQTQSDTALATMNAQESRGMENISHSYIKDSIKYRDPVCNIWVIPEGAKASVNYKGTDYYFCCKGCSDKFNENPDKYSGQTGYSESININNMRQSGRRHRGCC